MKPIFRGGGTTESERELSALADRAFLELWSYPNIYNDNRGSKSGDGKEICDLLVVFGDDVLIFSDKHISWNGEKDTYIAWKRWFRRAVKKSVDQVRGAERWLREHPDRVFTDKDCIHKLPLELPPLERRRVHGVVVALGAEEAASNYFGQSGSSFAIASEIKGDQHAPTDDQKCRPFFIGDVDPTGPFVHVFDRLGLNLVLTELDTVNDFTRYLNHRADAIRSGKIVYAANEADLISIYLSNDDKGGNHCFKVRGDTVETKYVVEHGSYKKLTERPEYSEKQLANEISYAWDRLIGLFTETVLAGTAISSLDQDISTQQVEQALRIMAAEDRTRRRALSEAFMGALNSSRKNPTARFSRAVLPLDDAPDAYCAYVFVFVPFPVSVHLKDGYEQYRRVRNQILATYAYAVLRRHRHLKRAIGIAMEGDGSPHHDSGSSEDLALLEVEEWTQSLEQEVIENERLFDVMRDERVEFSTFSVQEFPPMHKPLAEKKSRQQKRSEERRAKKALRSLMKGL